MLSITKSIFAIRTVRIAYWREVAPNGGFVALDVDEPVVNVNPK